ncbi:MAG: hypothetical protein HYX75_18895 [Acidobacteria bacterium]|nr:hypothetical protein [Acidobacteriota bacterium]
MIKRIAYALAALVLFGAGVKAEEGGAGTPQEPGAPLMLQLVFNRYHGDKRIESVPYSLPVTANGGSTRVVIGIQIPLKYEGKEFPGNVVYKNAGRDVTVRADALNDGRFKVSCLFDQSAVYSNNDEASPAGGGGASLAPPILRHLSSEATLVLGDGQTGQHTVATDPMNGDVVRVDVTLRVVK